MILYHASNCAVNKPDVCHSRALLDFGKGFYLTSLQEQERKYALRFLMRGEATYLNQYVLDDALDGFRVKAFDRYDEEWLDFVAACRKGKQPECYDLVAGGVADDKLFNTVDLYFSENMSKDEALKRLSFVHPNHQVCILDQDVIDRHLHFVKAEEIKRM